MGPDEPDMADPGLDWRGEERGWKGKRGKEGAGGGWWLGNLAIWQSGSLKAWRPESLAAWKPGSLALEALV